MHYLVNGIVATGADAFHPGQTPAPSEDEEGSISDTGMNGHSNSEATGPSATIRNNSVDEDEPASVNFGSPFYQFI
jgi:hypothetical protein